MSGHLIDRNLRSHTIEYLQRVEELLAHITAGIGNGVVTAYHDGAASVHHLAHVHDKGIGSGTVVGQCHAESFELGGGSGSGGQHIDGAAIVGHHGKVARDGGQIGVAHINRIGIRSRTVVGIYHIDIRNIEGVTSIGIHGQRGGEGIGIGHTVAAPSVGERSFTANDLCGQRIGTDIRTERVKGLDDGDDR